MKEQILFGTYTKSTSQGIYRGELDTEAQTLTNLGLVTKVGNPTYLAVSKAQRLYSVDKEDDDQGGVGAWNLSATTAEKINEVVSPGAPPAYVAVDEARQLVYSANYHKGTANVYHISADGALELVDSVAHAGSGPRPEQDSAHIHFTDLTPDQRLVVVDLGADKVYVYNVAGTGKLSLQSTYSTPAGFGPRHIVFSPINDYAFLVGELSSKVATLKYDAASGSFQSVSTVTTIPTDFTEHNGAAAIRISNDGRYLYVSNRGYNSLAVFAIATDGTLSLIQQISTEGDFPRDFALDATEKFVVAVNQNTNNGSLYARDAETGKLTLLQKDVTIPEGVCVHFLN